MKREIDQHSSNQGCIKIPRMPVLGDHHQLRTHEALVPAMTLQLFGMLLHYSDLILFMRELTGKGDL